MCIVCCIVRDCEWVIDLSSLATVRIVQPIMLCVLLYYVMFYDIILYCHITPHHITPHLITSHHNTSHHTTSHLTTSHHISSHHITSHHITSHHISPHHITPHHISSHHTTSHHITSHHIIYMLLDCLGRGRWMGERISKLHRDFSRKIEGTNNVHLKESILINFAIFSAPSPKHREH
jgi:hypothetical protein